MEEGQEEGHRFCLFAVDVFRYDTSFSNVSVLLCVGFCLFIK